jgi:DNA-binding protein YbaB
MQIDDSLLTNAEELEDYLIMTLNSVIKKASEINEQELAIAAKSGMPNITEMDMFK